MAYTHLSSNIGPLTPVGDDTTAIQGAPRDRADLAEVPMEPLAVTSRKQRVVTLPSRGPLSNFSHYDDDVPMKTVLRNRALLAIANHISHMELKRQILRKVGIRIGRDVSVAPQVNFDPLFPEYIEIEDGAIIGLGAVLYSHQYGTHSYEIGRTRIGFRAMIGALSVVVPGVVVGEGAALGPGSVLTRDIPPYEFWAGVPARKIAEHRPPQ
jgi:acetyltransferase-like isoleucine patch superfamily enzyme